MYTATLYDITVNINKHATIQCDSKLYKLNMLKTIFKKLLQQFHTDTHIDNI